MALRTEQEERIKETIKFLNNLDKHIEKNGIPRNMTVEEYQEEFRGYLFSLYNDKTPIWVRVRGPFEIEIYDKRKSGLLRRYTSVPQDTDSIISYKHHGNSTGPDDEQAYKILTKIYKKLDIVHEMYLKHESEMNRKKEQDSVNKLEEINNKFDQ